MFNVARALREVDGILVAIRDRADMLVAEPHAAHHHRRAIHGLIATARAAFADAWAPPEDDHATP